MPDDEAKNHKNAETEQDEGEGASGHDEAASAPKADEAAQRVAKALGVEGPSPDEDGDEPEASAGPEAAPNRAARRQDAAVRRKKRKAGQATASASSKDESEPEELPKDKNARAKELLKRRREKAAAPRPVQLLPGEMVDDALARSSSAAAKWIRKNFGVLQWVILGGIAAGGGYIFYLTQTEKRDAAATADLYAGVAADRGRVVADDKRSDEEKEFDPTKVFKTAEARTESELAGYQKAIKDHPNTGTAMLARLGEAGAYLDKHEWDKALEAFSAVSASSLAAADADVKGRALEGLGFAKEGKGDLAGALTTFKELQLVDARGFKELGMYHEARVLLAKGETDRAKDLLKQLFDKLPAPTSEDAHSLRYVRQMTEDALRRIDPSLVPSKLPIGGGQGTTLTKEQIERIIREKQREAQNKGQH